MKYGVKMNYSPLRYPGSKNKFYPIVKNYMKLCNISTKTSYAEPYAGGASVALRLLLNNEVSEIHINDFDKAIYSFWYSIINNTIKFLDKIEDTSIDIENWRQQKEILKTSKDILLLGFAVFYLNRTNFSGIIKGGPIGGLKQDREYKISCRFNKANLINKIETIASIKKKIKVYNLDAITFIQKIDKTSNCFMYIDPPYYNKGKELYMNFYKEEDHKKLNEIVSTIKNHWLLSYDKCDFIEALYKDFITETKPLFYSAGYKKIGNELLISKNLPITLY